MSAEMIVVTGATGNVGKRLAETLLSRGQRVRAVGRSAERLAPFAAEGAEAFVGSVTDASSMRRALEGATALFAMVPPAYETPNAQAYQEGVAGAYASALAGSSVAHVVVLSSVGAHVPSGTGPIAGLHALEERLNAITGLNVLSLRPAYFMENFLFSIGVIRQMGVCGTPLKADMPMEMIATRDIADYASRAFIDRGWSGKSARELLGPRDITMRDATTVLGKAIGKPDLAYVQFPDEEVEKALIGMGVAPSWAASFIEMDRAINERKVRPVEARSKENTTPTTIEQFAPAFAAAYAAAT
jgi:uncharacterized protein YbjT (DUF2867 family)